MSELIQAINPNIAIMVTVGFCILCAGGFVLIFLMQFIGFGLEIIAGIIQFAFGIITGGPIAWCGCLIFIFICGGCGFITVILASIIPKCGTPDAVNLCRFIGA